jgi:hypothetical protein
MKVLFLDIDGVVNCVTTAQRHRGMIGIDPYMALLVDRIIQATGCEVVLSSTWRLFEESRKEVKKQVCDFIDVTPELNEIRGKEVEAWMQAHPGVTTYAILDDNSDFLGYQPLFKTSWSTGLTQEIANEVIAHLNKPHATQTV